MVHDEDENGIHFKKKMVLSIAIDLKLINRALASPNSFLRILLWLWHYLNGVWVCVLLGILENNG